MKNGFKVLDSDIHVTEPDTLWADYMEADFKDSAPIRVVDEGSWSAGMWRSDGKLLPAYMDVAERSRTMRVREEISAERYVQSGRQLVSGAESDQDEGTRPEHMLEAMGVEGVDVAVVFRTMGAHVIGIDEMDPNLSAAICRGYNDWLHDFCAMQPSALKVGALMPMQDVDLAVHEANRAVDKLGAVTLILPSNPVCERPWYSEYYHPFWAAAESLGVPVSFHGIQMAYQDHLAKRYMDNHALGHSVAHPVEMICTAGAMVTGGIFERFPTLKTAFLEGHSSWVPWWLYCLDEHEEKMGDKERFGLVLSPSEYFLRQCFVSVDPDEALVKYTIDAIGDDNLVISTDWPHDDSAYPNAIDTFLGLEGVSQASQQKVLWDNCARLYDID